VSRRRPHRRPSQAELLARMPRAFRPRLDAGQRLDLALCHNENLDAIVTGKAEPSMIWDYLGGVLTWWKAAQLLQVGVPEMDLQLEVATRLVERYGRTGRVLFDGTDLQLARDGVVVMDELARLVDRPNAIAAADWSENEVNRLWSGEIRAWPMVAGAGLCRAGCEARGAAAA
jgi:hypothetical protein